MRCYLHGPTYSDHRERRQPRPSAKSTRVGVPTEPKELMADRGPLGLALEGTCMISYMISYIQIRGHT